MLGLNIFFQCRQTSFRLQRVQKRQATKYVTNDPLVISIKLAPIIHVVGNWNPCIQPELLGQLFPGGFVDHIRDFIPIDCLVVF